MAGLLVAGPSSVHNPVLLKPATDRRVFIVLRGQPGGTLESHVDLVALRELGTRPRS